MSPESNISVESFSRHCNGQMIPVNDSLSYFSVIPLEDSELQRLIYDPAAAVPPKLLTILPNLRWIIVAYLAESDDEDFPLVTFQRPGNGEQVYSAVVENAGADYIYLAIRDEDMADCHDTLYDELAALIARKGQSELGPKFLALVKDELANQCRGEIDDDGWELKEELLRTQADVTQETELLKIYVEQALIDTLSLYLHGLCCDIDVDPGPRQLASRHIRKRLNLLRELLPPPEGVPLFPEELPAAE